MDNALEPTVDPDQERSGPGLVAKDGVDPTVVVGWVLVLLGFTPTSLWERILGFGYFGPIEVSAIITMVGVLFAFIAVLRSIDLGDMRLRLFGGIALGLGLVRLFLMPWF